jgi:hypothetical protein
MTRLRRMMLEEFERRNYSPGTTRCYLRPATDFARCFQRSPDQLRPEHVRKYQPYLFHERKLDASSHPRLGMPAAFLYGRLRGLFLERQRHRKPPRSSLPEVWRRLQMVLVRILGLC